MSAHFPPAAEGLQASTSPRVRAGMLKALRMPAFSSSSWTDITVSLYKSFTAALGMQKFALQAFTPLNREKK